MVRSAVEQSREVCVGSDPVKKVRKTFGGV